MESYYKILKCIVIIGIICLLAWFLFLSRETFREKFDKIDKGWTIEQVERSLGSPDEVMRDNETGNKTYIYDRSSEKVPFAVLVYYVKFDTDNKVLSTDIMTF